MAARLAFERFTSSAALLGAISSRPVNAAFEGHTLDSHEIDNRRNPWSGAASWGDACEIARAGYPDAVQDMRTACGRAGDALAGAVDEVKRSRVWGVIGDSVSVARALAGSPRYMQRTRRETVTRPGLRFVWDGCVSGNTSTADIIAAGGRFVALIDALRCAGVPVSLDVAFAHCGGRGEAAIMRLELARAGESPALCNLAYWLAHPSALRRIMFGWLETCPTLKSSREWVGSYGSVAHYSAARLGWADKMREALTDGGAARLVRMDDFRRDSEVVDMFRELTGAR